MLLEKNAFDPASSTPLDPALHELPQNTDPQETRAHIIAGCILGAYLAALIIGVLVIGPAAALAWALMSAPLAGAWVLYTTWFVPD